MKVVITGSNGFLGAHLVRESLRAGHETLALIRNGANISRLPDHRNLTIETFDYSDKEAIQKSVTVILSKYGRIDALIHNAGLTVAINPEHYFKINTTITEHLLSAVKKNSFIKKDGFWIQISSYSAQGPEGFNQPVSCYGNSKLAAEKVIRESKFNYLIIRPTAVYGSGDSAFLPMFKAAKFGFFPLLAPINQRITLIHGADLSRFIIGKLGKVKNSETLHLSDGKVYSHQDLQAALESVFNKKLFHFRVPKAVLRNGLKISDFISSKTSINPAMTLEKYKEISNDWNLRKNQELNHVNLNKHYSLENGFEEAYNYYKSVNLL